MLVFGGPNGSGKSTTINEARKSPHFPVNYINADDIAAVELSAVQDRTEREVKAAQLAEARRREAVESGRSFAFETVMSTPEKVALIAQAKERGFQVQLVFVTTEDPDINVRRVRKRVEQSGHPVPEDKIRQRYENAMALMPHAVLYADKAVIFDNSAEGEGGKPAVPLKVAQKESGELKIKAAPEDLPDWVRDRLAIPYLQMNRSRNELVDQALAHANGKAPVKIVDADSSHGQRHEGLVLSATDHHFLLVQKGKRYSIHDRRLYPLEVKVGVPHVIAYAWSKGKFDEEEALRRGAGVQTNPAAMSLLGRLKGPTKTDPPANDNFPTPG